MFVLFVAKLMLLPENEETLEKGKRLFLPLTDRHPTPGNISHYRWIRLALS